MLSKNKLFDILNLSSGEKSELNSIKPEFNINFIKAKMFVKLIEEMDYFSLYIKKILTDKSPYEIDKLTNYLIFNKAVSYLEGIEIDKLILYSEFVGMKSKFIETLQKSIQYFEFEEQYEICAFLFNIKKSIENLA